MGSSDGLGAPRDHLCHLHQEITLIMFFGVVSFEGFFKLTNEPLGAGRKTYRTLNYE